MNLNFWVTASYAIFQTQTNFFAREGLIVEEEGLFANELNKDPPISIPFH
jgi:hypothetical protein